MTDISIIVPAFNNAQWIGAALQALAPMRARGVEVIVVDGGSTDGTAQLAAPLADRVLVAENRRAAQMNAGANIAQGYILLFLPVGIWLPPEADALLLHGPGREFALWGRFDIEIEGAHWLLPLVSRLINAHSRATGFATGAQALFMTREAFSRTGGFPDLSCMEDIVIAQKLKTLSPPLCLRAKALTADETFMRDGFWRTLWRMARLRLAWHLGTDPAELARRYPPRPHNSIVSRSET
jgi:rSAM/selenodomain-associated transferase 2